MCTSAEGAGGSLGEVMSSFDTERSSGFRELEKGRVQEANESFEGISVVGTNLDVNVVQDAIGAHLTRRAREGGGSGTESCRSVRTKTMSPFCKHTSSTHPYVGRKRVVMAGQRGEPTQLFARLVCGIAEGRRVAEGN